MQLNALDSMASASIKSIGFLAINEVGLRDTYVHFPPNNFFQGVTPLEKEWLPFMFHLRPCPVSPPVEKGKRKPADDGIAASATVKLIDALECERTEKARIDVDVPETTLKTSAVVGAKN